MLSIRAYEQFYNAEATIKKHFKIGDDYEFIYGVFSSCGLAVKVREEDMDTVIAVSSSAPAYYFLLYTRNGNAKLCTGITSASGILCTVKMDTCMEHKFT